MFTDVEIRTVDLWWRLCQLCHSHCPPGGIVERTESINQLSYQEVESVFLVTWSTKVENRGRQFRFSFSWQDASNV